MSSIYMDYAATSPLRPEAAAAWLDADVPGNPSSPHRPGRQARAVIDAARESIAANLGAKPGDVVFTSGGTEGAGIAVQGLFAARQISQQRPFLLVSAVEHPAVLENAKLAGERLGAKVATVPVSGDGVVDVGFVAEHLARHAKQTALISVMWANNETGAIQPVTDIVQLAAEVGVPVHSDAVQAAGRVKLAFRETGLAAMSLSAHKLGGPVGVGVLLLGEGWQPSAVIGGGGQERKVRSGTLDARGAAAMAAALAATQQEDHAQLEAMLAPLDKLVATHPALRSVTPPAHLPGLRGFTVAGATSEALLFLLDQAGLAVASGSACHSGVARESHVMAAMGLGLAEVGAPLRVSLGHNSKPNDVARLVEVLPHVIEQAAKVSA